MFYTEKVPGGSETYPVGGVYFFLGSVALIRIGELFPRTISRDLRIDIHF